MPIVLYDFHVFPLFFIPANLIVTPFLEWVIIAGPVSYTHLWRHHFAHIPVKMGQLADTG